MPTSLAVNVNIIQLPPDSFPRLTVIERRCYHGPVLMAHVEGLPLNELHERILACNACALSQKRTRVVPGEGPSTISVMFIGEAPGEQEDRQGRPFVGPAGQFLNELLAAAGLRRETVFITNVVKCRPPANREPLPGEIEACSLYLERQVALLKPKAIVTLGRYSMARYFPNESISRIHGRPKKVGNVVYFPMYHPAAALHQGSLRQVLLEDMARLPGILKEIEKTVEAATPSRQMSLF
jgi:DNA polymerase